MVTTLRYGSLDDTPILFANSFPKSGTHLLIQVLQGLTQISPIVDSGLPAIVTFDGPTGWPRQDSAILQDLHRLRPGDIAYGHLHSIPSLIPELTRPGIAAYFIYRDPRDVVVSHVHYVTKMEPNHVHHRYYTEELNSFDERLRVSILGLPELSVPFPDIRRRFDPYLGWLACPEVLSLRFEDFISHRSETLERILDHVQNRGLTVKLSRDESLRVMDESINPERSPTFRSGKIGKWRESFKDSHKSIFKEVAGDLLIQLGYEENNDW
jgi:hypothetical protein